jgi:hypothetical protein
MRCVVSFVVLELAVMGAATAACECAEVAQAVDYDVDFIGGVAASGGCSGNRSKLEVLQVGKGEVEVGEIVTVVDDGREDDCEVQMDEGTEWHVFGNLKGGAYHTDGCAVYGPLARQ